MQTVIKRHSVVSQTQDERQDLFFKLMKKFADSGMDYKGFQFSVILPALGEMKQIREMSRDELSKVLDEMREDVS